MDTIIPIGLIANELITNSLKYAFPNNQGGIIKIALIEIEDQLHLSVNDNGKGMTEEIKNQLGNSFGFKLINAFMAQLEGDYTITDNQPGTAIEIRISNYDKT